jgi:hypothetical protein
MGYYFFAKESFMPGALVDSIRYFSSPFQPDPGTVDFRAYDGPLCQLPDALNKIDIRSFLESAISLFKEHSAEYICVKLHEPKEGERLRNFKLFIDELSSQRARDFVIMKDLVFTPWSYNYNDGGKGEGHQVGQAIAIWNTETAQFRKVDEILNDMDQRVKSPTQDYHASDFISSSEESEDDDIDENPSGGQFGYQNKNNNNFHYSGGGNSDFDWSLNGNEDFHDSGFDYASVVMNKGSHPSQVGTNHYTGAPKGYEDSPFWNVGDGDSGSDDGGIYDKAAGKPSAFYLFDPSEFEDEDDEISPIEKARQRTKMTRLIGMTIVTSALFLTSVYAGRHKITAWIQGK